MWPAGRTLTRPGLGYAYAPPFVASALSYAHMFCTVIIEHVVLSHINLVSVLTLKAARRTLMKLTPRCRVLSTALAVILLEEDLISLQMHGQPDS